MGNCGNIEIDPEVEKAETVDKLLSILKERSDITKKQLNQLNVFLSFKIKPKDINISDLTNKEIQKKAAFLKKYYQTQILCYKDLDNKTDLNLQEVKSLLNNLFIAEYNNKESALYDFPEKLQNLRFKYKNKKRSGLKAFKSTRINLNTKKFNYQGNALYGSKFDQKSAIEGEINLSEPVSIAEEPPSPRSLTINTINKVGNCQIEHPIQNKNFNEIKELEEKEELSKRTESIRETEKINCVNKEVKVSVLENFNLEESNEITKKEEEEEQKKNIKMENCEQDLKVQSPNKKIMVKTNEGTRNKKNELITIADMVQLTDVKDPSRLTQLKSSHIKKKVIPLQKMKVKKMNINNDEKERELVADTVSESQKSSYTNSKNASSISKDKKKIKKRKKIAKKDDSNSIHKGNENKITNINENKIVVNRNFTKNLINKQKNCKDVEPKGMTISTNTDDKELNEEIKKLKEDLNFITTDENGNSVIKQLNFKNIRNNDV